MFLRFFKLKLEKYIQKKNRKKNAKKIIIFLSYLFLHIAILQNETQQNVRIILDFFKINWKTKQFLKISERNRLKMMTKENKTIF